MTGSAAMTQIEVVHALILRETRSTYGNSPAGYLWALLEPAAWIGMFYAMFVVSGRDEGISGMDALGFLVTGICTFMTFKKVWKVSSNASKAKGLLGLPRVTPLDVAVARAVLTTTTMVSVFLLFMTLNWLALGETWHVDNVLWVMAGIVLAALMGFGFGQALGALGLYTQIFKHLDTLLVRPLFWTSGLFFAADALPSAIREIFLYNPVLHTVELVRGGWFTTYRAMHVSPFYAVAWTMGCLLVGLAAERATRRKALG